MSTTKPIRVGVVGTGLMGAVHAKSLRYRVAGAVLAGVSDFDTARAADLAGELGTVAFGTGEELIASDDVDAVVVASPDNTHADYAIACIHAAKSVLCEKPLAETAARALQVVEAERSTGRRLVQVGFMREFDDAHMAVRSAVVSGRLGRPVMFRGTHINPAPVGATDVERALSQSLIHDINSARFLMGREIVEVVARWVPREDTDPAECRIAAVMCTFDDGAIGLMDVNIESGYGYVVAAEVVGTIGTASTVNPATSSVAVAGQTAIDVSPNWATRFAPAYLNELDAWVASLAEGISVGPGAYDGYIANVIADACIQSARTGHPVAIATR
jgi:myo-inositol 2-dehydrogenase / D-chiro-inositol 1-dehydrogenase